ncbi:MAG: NAD(+) diphosphatase [Gammaproteobacteria bacterium]|nr:NAD(+) diphosphatase [Gammaproteobacteria bacterium]
MQPASPLQEYWFIFQNDHLAFIKNDHDYALPTSHEAFSASSLLRKYALGLLNQATCYCAEIESAAPMPTAISFIPLRKAFELLGETRYSMAVKAYSIINWDKNHQYCGRCAHVTEHQAGRFERLCTACGLSLFPRISPSIIVLIKKADHLLMARSPHFPPGAYGLIAGFLEAGENIEEAIHREVLEEVGIRIKNLCYFGSQAWPFPDSLMIAFTADYAAGELMIDHQEIEMADWYRFDNLPGRPSSSVSIARKLIDHFIAEQQSLAGIHHGNL